MRNCIQRFNEEREKKHTLAKARSMKITIDFCYWCCWSCVWWRQRRCRWSNVNSTNHQLHLLNSLAIDNVPWLHTSPSESWFKLFQEVKLRKSVCRFWSVNGSGHEMQTRSVGAEAARENDIGAKQKNHSRLCALNNFKMHINNNSSITWWNFNWSAGCRRQSIANKYAAGALLPMNVERSFFHSIPIT